MAETVADLVVSRLREWGVHRLFGYTGDGIDPVMEALRRAAGDQELVQARHEEQCALMAVGHAKYTGGLGVCVATQGPGAVHLLNGPYDAKLDSAPVLAVVGQQATSALGSTYQQEVDLQVLLQGPCRFVQTAMSAEQLPMLLDRAVRTALAERGPTAIVLPADVQRLQAPDPGERAHGVMRTSTAFARPRAVPSAEELDRAVAVLTSGTRPILLAGQGVAGAGDLVLELADRLGAGVTTSLLGKPHVDEDHRLSCGVMGHLGTTAAQRLVDGCDTLLLLGTNDPWTEFYPAPGQARAVQVDADPVKLGGRYPVEIGLAGDAGATIRALLDRLPDRRVGWRDEVAGFRAEWERIAAAKVAAEAAPLNP